MEIYFESYGCTANQNSTEIMKGIVKQSGFNITSSIDYADLIIINSCIAKEPTEEKIRRRIQDLAKKNKKVILAGCMPRTNKKSLQSKNLFFLDTSQIKNLTNLIQDIYDNSYEEEKYLKQRNEIKLNLPKISKEKFIGITQISEGCFGECTYCATRFTKGKLFSYPLNEIVRSVQNDLLSGCKEIWITSQNCASYGSDKGRYLLPELLKEMIKIKKNFLVRVGMSNPNDVMKILKELIEVYENKKIFKFLHVPVQSGSNKILKAMKRKYSKEDFLEVSGEFRKKFPDMHLSTDVIVGFPGETEKDFQETLELIKRIKPETLNVSKFWARPGTPAEKMKEQINPEIKKARAIKIMKLHKQICEENQKRFLNTGYEVLIDQRGFGNTYLARDSNYKLFAVQSEEKILGKHIKIRVKKLAFHYLIGEVVK